MLPCHLFIISFCPFVNFLEIIIFFIKKIMYTLEISTGVRLSTTSIDHGHVPSAVKISVLEASCKTDGQSSDTRWTATAEWLTG